MTSDSTPSTRDTAAEDGAEAGRELGAASYTMYYALLFSAYWFGSSRFDPERDEQFDPENVQAYLNEPSVLQRNRMRSVRSTSKESSAQMRAARSTSKDSNVQQGGGLRSASKDSAAQQGAGLRSASKESGAQQGAGLRSASKDSSLQQDGAMQSQRSRSKEMPRIAMRSESESDNCLDEALPAIAEDRVIEEVLCASSASVSTTRSVAPEGFQRLWRLMTSSVSSAAEEDVIVTNLKTGQVLPIFVVLEAAAVAVLWFVTAGIESDWNTADLASATGGLESIWRGETDLRATDDSCRDCRQQVWRWFTYQFTHIGFSHACMNAFVLVVLGVPLEGMHGHLRMFIMFNAGVIGGGLCALVLNPHLVTVGCSAGVAALLGIHFADLLVNWRSKKFRYPTLAVLIVLVVSSAMFDILQPTETINSAGHVGGGIMGLLIGAGIGRSLKTGFRQRVAVLSGWLLGIAMLVLFVAWLFSQASPRSLAEAIAGESGWCWYRQMLDTSLSPVAYRCVRCSTPECVDFWRDFAAAEAPKLNGAPALHTVSFEKCVELGWHYDER